MNNYQSICNLSSCNDEQQSNMKETSPTGTDEVAGVADYCTFNAVYVYDILTFIK